VRAHAIRGATVCRMLGGAAPQVKAKAAARVFVDSLGKRLTQVPDGYSVDPTEALVGMISRSAFMAATWEAEIAALDDGEADELRMLLAQYDAERDRCARFSKWAIDAGVTERQVRLAEQQGQKIAEVITTTIDDTAATVCRDTSRGARHRRRTPARSYRRLADQILGNLLWYYYDMSK
jgi:hypothetical protein